MGRDRARVGNFDHAVYEGQIIALAGIVKGRRRQEPNKGCSEIFYLDAVLISPKLIIATENDEVNRDDNLRQENSRNVASGSSMPKHLFHQIIEELDIAEMSHCQG